MASRTVSTETEVRGAVAPTRASLRIVAEPRAGSGVGRPEPRLAATPKGSAVSNTSLVTDPSPVSRIANTVRSLLAAHGSGAPSGPISGENCLGMAGS